MGFSSVQNLNRLSKDRSKFRKTESQTRRVCETRMPLVATKSKYGKNLEVLLVTYILTSPHHPIYSLKFHALNFGLSCIRCNSIVWCRVILAHFIPYNGYFLRLEIFAIWTKKRSILIVAFLIFAIPFNRKKLLIDNYLHTWLWFSSAVMKYFKKA